MTKGNFGDTRGARRVFPRALMSRCSRCARLVRSVGFIVDADNTYDPDEGLCATCAAADVGIKLT